MNNSGYFSDKTVTPYGVIYRHGNIWDSTDQAEEHNRDNDAVERKAFVLFIIIMLSFMLVGGITGYEIAQNSKSKCESCGSIGRHARYIIRLCDKCQEKMEKADR